MARRGAAQCFTRSPSRLAATESFDSVSPEPAMPCTAARMRSTSPERGCDPCLDGVLPGHAIGEHFGGEPAFGFADRIQRAVEREPVEVVGDFDVLRGARDAVELEEGAGREVGRGDILHVLARCDPQPR